MKKRSILTRLASLALALVLAVSLVPAASAATSTSGMGNFKKVRSAPQFTDVSDADLNDVREAYEYGIMNGKPNNIFDPRGYITIAEALTIAGRVHAIYFGNTYKLDTRRSPWYSDAVDYAIDYGIIEEDEYENYGAYATRADLANLFYCIPAKEFPRINRIAWISDVSTDAEYFNYIYMLYSAGVLTGVSSGNDGSEPGAFLPDAYIYRVDAARIINRVILPANRKSVSLTTNAPGQVVDGANGNFKLSIPKNTGWEIAKNAVDEDGWCSFKCIKRTDNGTALLDISAAPKASYNWITLYSFMLSNLQTDTFESRGTYLDEDDISETTIRGLSGYYAEFVVDSLEWTIFCTENSTQMYSIHLVYNEDCDVNLINELIEVFLTLDIAL